MARIDRFYRWHVLFRVKSCAGLGHTHQPPVGAFAASSKYHQHHGILVAGRPSSMTLFGPHSETSWCGWLESHLDQRYICIITYYITLNARIIQTVLCNFLFKRWQITYHFVFLLDTDPNYLLRVFNLGSINILTYSHRRQNLKDLLEIFIFFWRLLCFKNKEKIIKHHYTYISSIFPLCKVVVSFYWKCGPRHWGLIGIYSLHSKTNQNIMAPIEILDKRNQSMVYLYIFRLPWHMLQIFE